MTGPAITGVGTLLRQLLGLFDGDVQAHYASLGIDFRPRFYPIVRRLIEGPATVNEIAVAMRATQPAATQTIGELKRLGLVASDPGDDRRERRIALTEEGHRAVEALRPSWLAIERAAAALDRELPCGLKATLEGALAALERRSFKDRIADAQRNEED